ncbi:MAG: putative DNA binding domain-containing protein [Spirochaetes bacterium]|nr:putative DNA binding domain-containing protein [Spirochaetota bacterium]
MTTIEQFQKWLTQKENTDLEFKAAKNNFDFDHKLSDYCAAIANDNGGKLILGVNDKTREIVETHAFFENWNKLSHNLLQRLGIRVDVEEFFYEKKRVLIFHIPKHFFGQPVMSNDVYWMRAGESLVPMDKQTLQKIFAEVASDFSAEIVPGFSIDDIDIVAFEKMRELWSNHLSRPEYKTFSMDKALHSLGLLSERGLNFAALILIGKEEKINLLLPDAEIIFEWRGEQDKIAYDFRTTWRAPFFAIFDDIWEVINARNIRFPFQEGFVQREIFAFHKKVIREVIFNAVAHRDYRVQGQSIFIKASPKEFFIESPGGLMPGITIENILFRKAWRNRCIAEVFEKTHLVERSGQGIDDIFEITIREGKGIPDLSKTDNYTVRVKIPAEVKDENFIMYLEKITNKKQIILSFEEIFELEKIRENRIIKNIKFRDKFLELGIIERVGKTSGSQYILSHRYYSFEEKLGLYTRIVGISRDEKKQLILKHLAKNKKGLTRDFKDVFSDLKSKDVSNLLQELRKDGKIDHKGSDRGGYWILKG